MKKIFLSAATLLFVGSAFAQSGMEAFNESEVLATGMNTGTITQQIGVGVANYSELTQTGVNNAIVNQIGGNDSYIVQVGAGNTADVMQDVGAALMYQVSNVNQSGIGNDADVNQNGMGNESDIDQATPAPPTGLLNIARVQQGQLAPSSGNLSVVNQNNWGNSTEHTQNGIGNSASSVQSSTAIAAVQLVPLFFQTVETTQTGDRNFADVNQTGDNNRSVITQDAAFGFMVPLFTNEATVVQMGDGNSSVIDQRDGMMVSANNTLTVSQTNNVLGTTGIVNFSNVAQTGDNSWTVGQVNN